MNSVEEYFNHVQQLIDHTPDAPLNGTKSSFYQRTEESFASGCAFQTTLCWKSAKPSSLLPESPTGLLTAIIIKTHRLS